MLTKFQAKIVEKLNEELAVSSCLSVHGRATIRFRADSCETFGNILDQLLCLGLKHSACLKLLLKATRQVEPLN